MSDGGRGVVLRGQDAQIEAEAKRRKLGLVISTDGVCPFDEALVVEPGTRVPWDMLDKGFEFLEAWDAAVPLWRYGVLAKDLGTCEERRITEKLTLDLRIPVYACELLFVRCGPSGGPSEASGQASPGRLLLEALEEERHRGTDARLAFLRAVARVKPRLCVLPSSWLGLADERSKADARSRAAMPVARPAPVRIEVAPGRWVLCQEGQEERVRERFRKVSRVK